MSLQNESCGLSLEVVCGLVGSLMSMTAKEEARKMLDLLPEDATWEDLQYSIYVRERVERGRLEADHGAVIDQAEIEDRMKRRQTD